MFQYDQVEAAGLAVSQVLSGSQCDKEGPSQHLTWKELASHDGVPYPEMFWLEANQLASEFEFVRALLGGKPIKIGSGYRSPKHNKDVGGVKDSQHTLGRDIDMHHRNPTKLLEACLFRYRNYNTSYIRGLGLYPWGVHMDIRRSGRLARWTVK